MSLERGTSSRLPSRPSAPVFDMLNDEYETWKFNGTFRNFSRYEYKGPRNGDVDKAWAVLFTCAFRPLSLSPVIANNGNVLISTIRNCLQQWPPPLPTSSLPAFGSSAVVAQTRLGCSSTQLTIVSRTVSGSASIKTTYLICGSIFQDWDVVLLKPLSELTSIFIQLFPSAYQKIICDAILRSKKSF